MRFSFGTKRKQLSLTNLLFHLHRVRHRVVLPTAIMSTERINNDYTYPNFSDPNSILGGVRLPPDTEIIKYTSSIVGPKIPGTTNRGRKKTISLDPPSVSLHPTLSSTGMLIERSTKRPKLVSFRIWHVFCLWISPLAEVFCNMKHEKIDLTKFN